MIQREDKVALVTGAGRGIGRAIALALASAGYALCIAARTQEELEETRGKAGLTPARALIVLVDLAEPDAPGNLIDAMIGHFGRIDVLVNNAGWAPARTPLVKTREADVNRILEVNLRAPIALARLAATRMIAQASGGAIINIASVAAWAAGPGETVYAAAKAGLIAFTRAGFIEFRPHGIKTAAIIPGLTDTALIPSNRRLERSAMLRPEDIAAAVMSIVNAAPGACPREIVLEPSHDPMRAG